MEAKTVESRLYKHKVPDNPIYKTGMDEIIMIKISPVLVGLLQLAIVGYATSLM